VLDWMMQNIFHAAALMEAKLNTIGKPFGIPLDEPSTGNIFGSKTISQAAQLISSIDNSGAVDEKRKDEIFALQ